MTGNRADDDIIAHIEHLLVSYHPTTEWLEHYLHTYFYAAKIHLSDGGNVIVEWLATILER